MIFFETERNKENLVKKKNKLKEFKEMAKDVSLSFFEDSNCQECKMPKDSFKSDK